MGVAARTAVTTVEGLGPWIGTRVSGHAVAARGAAVAAKRRVGGVAKPLADRDWMVDTSIAGRGDPHSLPLSMGTLQINFVVIT